MISINTLQIIKKNKMFTDNKTNITIIGTRKMNLIVGTYKIKLV